MWNDTVRKQSESSFITGDINSSASLNRGNYKLFFISLTCDGFKESEMCCPFFSPLPLNGTGLPHKKCYNDNWEEVL